MSNYTKTTDFEAKDSLPSGDSGKIIRGSEFETEFDNIATAIATKADAASPTFTGTVTIDGLTVNGNTTLGNAATDTVTVTADIASNLIPSADDTYDLGASGAEWNDLYIDGTANIDSLVADTADIDGGTVDSLTSLSLASGNLTLPDSSKAIFGAGSDLEIYHDGSGSYIKEEGAGSLFVQSNGVGIVLEHTDGTNLLFADAGNQAVTLYNGGSAKLATTSTGVDITGNATFDDSGKAIFGADSDLSIYHDGSNSYIDDSGTGLLRLRSSQIYLEKYTGEIMAALTADAGVNLRYDNAIKLETTATGIDVTGTVTADGLTVDGNATIGQTSASDRTLSIGSAGATHFDVTTAGATGIVTLNATNDATAGKINLQTADTNRLLISNNGDISFYEDTGTTAKFFWDASAERLGLGTTSPARDLHIVQNDDWAQIRLEGNSTGGAEIMMGDGTTESKGRIQYVNASNYMRFDTSEAERMRIDSSGNVGIGTSSPAYVLDIESAGTDSENLARFSSSGGVRAIINTDSDDDGSFSLYDQNDAVKTLIRSAGSSYFNGGNVGIGTNSPAAKLEVALGAEGEYLRIGGDNVSNTRGLAFTSSTATSNGALHTIDAKSSNGVIALATGGAEAMRIDSSGHVIVPNGVTLGTTAGTYAAANTLDDYEEGTFTPTTASDATGVFGTATGSYTKVGDLVFLDIAFTVTTNFTTNKIGGLPFTASVQNGASAVRPMASMNGLAVGTARYEHNQATLRFTDSSGSDVNLNTTDATYRISGVYRAS